MPGIHFALTWIDLLFLGGIPNNSAAAFDGSYLSTIHGGLGSDSPNAFQSTAAPNLQKMVPAFPQPEVTGYYDGLVAVGPNNENGFLQSEKRVRSRDDSNMGPGVTQQSTDGRNRLIFHLWVFSITNPGVDYFTLKIFRDLNSNDKTGNFGVNPADPLLAQLVYQYGPVRSTITGQPQPNMAINAPVDLPAGCNLYGVIRNDTDNLAQNQIIGSIRLVP